MGFLKRFLVMVLHIEPLRVFPEGQTQNKTTKKKVRTMLVMTGNRVNKIFKSSITIMLPTDVVVLCCKSEEKRNKMPMLGF